MCLSRNRQVKQKSFAPASIGFLVQSIQLKEHHIWCDIVLVQLPVWSYTYKKSHKFSKFYKCFHQLLACNFCYKTILLRNQIQKGHVLLQAVTENTVTEHFLPQTTADARWESIAKIILFKSGKNGIIAGDSQIHPFSQKAKKKSQYVLELQCVEYNHQIQLHVWICKYIHVQNEHLMKAGP